MPYLTVGKENGTNVEIYYKDWGSGQPIVFSHGWPLSADASLKEIATSEVAAFQPAYLRAFLGLTPFIGTRKCFSF
jgi:pimeloyl-ACP methyl ester carboxylesterase